MQCIVINVLQSADGRYALQSPLPTPVVGAILSALVAELCAKHAQAASEGLIVPNFSKSLPPHDNVGEL